MSGFKGRCVKESAGRPAATSDGAFRKRMTTAALVAALGSFTFIGCASQGSSGDASASQVGSSTPSREYVQQRAGESNLPDRYVNEARVGLIGVEERRADAEVTDVTREASLRERRAHVDAERQRIVSDHARALAEAKQLAAEYQAEQENMLSNIVARERHLTTATTETQSMLAALGKEKRTRQSDLVSLAEQDFQEANAHIEQMKAIRRATEEESHASIEDMRKAAEATRERAVAVVRALNTEADSVQRQTQAGATELANRIITVSEQAEAKFHNLSNRSESTVDEADARAKRLRARAEATEKQKAGEEHKVLLQRAHHRWEQAQAEHGQQSRHARGMYERHLGEIFLLEAEAQKQAQQTEVHFVQQVGELDGWYKDALAEVEDIHVAAIRAESMARNEFIKAEAEARAAAQRETAAHQQELAEQLQRQIEADARAEAARVREQIVADLARQQKSGSVERTGKTAPAAEQAEGLHDVPNHPEVAEVTPVVEPERVAAFRASLAEVMKERARGDAKKQVVEATYQEAMLTLGADRDQRLALAEERRGQARNLRTQADARFATAKSELQAGLSTARANHEAELAEVETFRNDALAGAADLRNEAKAEVEIAQVMARQFKVEAEAAKKQGENERAALEAELASLKQRGEAEHRRLVAEASSVKRGQAAMAKQIDGQIAAAEVSLEAELAKLDESVQSQDVVAKATYRESMTHADVAGRMVDVEMSRLNARYQLEQALTGAEINRSRSVLQIAGLKSEAEIERRQAEASANAERGLARMDVDVVTARVEDAIAKARADSQRQIANSQERAVKAMLDARVVQVGSQRTRLEAYARRNEVFRAANVESALAEAQAARDKTRERLDEMMNQQKRLERAAATNWDIVLAGSQEFDHKPDTEVVEGELKRPESVRGEQVKFSGVDTSNYDD